MNGKQLKNSILQWAIQGKLVPQDPNDEPASVLLERIREEKKRLIKEGKIKKDKNESIIFKGDDNSYYEKFADGKVICIDEEIPFEIPAGWEWTRIRQVCSMQAGKNITSSEISSVITPTKHYPCYGGNGIRGYVAKCNTVGTYPIVGRQGALCGNVNMASGEFYATEHAVVTDNYNQTDVKWLYWFLIALNLNQYATATAQPGLAVSNIIEVLLPVPPRKEQTVIAHTLDDIQPLISRFEESEVALSKLNTSIRVDLQKSILQEAIQGKLVPQDSADEPAATLLERISAEKQLLVKDGKIKAKDAVTSTIFKGDDNKYYEKVGANTLDISEEIPFDLPDSWSWCRLSSIASMRIGKTPARGDLRFWASPQYNWVSISDMSDYGHITETKEQVSEIAAKESFHGQLSQPGDLLMSFKLTVGRTSILDIPAFHNEAIVTIRPILDSSMLLRDWLFTILPVVANMGDSKDAIKGKTLNSQSLASLLIPVAPLYETKRILMKYNEALKHLQ